MIQATPAAPGSPNQMLPTDSSRFVPSDPNSTASRTAPQNTRQEGGAGRGHRGFRLWRHEVARPAADTAVRDPA
jgi:hypothetical protein